MVWKKKYEYIAVSSVALVYTILTTTIYNLRASLGLGVFVFLCLILITYFFSEPLIKLPSKFTIFDLAFLLISIPVIVKNGGPNSSVEAILLAFLPLLFFVCVIVISRRKHWGDKKMH